MSIREIARMTGLSITTVSHAINGTRPVSEKSRRLVEEAIRRTGYRPNLAARALKTQKSNIIALIIPSTEPGNSTNCFFFDVLGGVKDTLQRRGYDLIVSTYSERRSDIRLDSVSVLKKSWIDGLLLVPNSRHSRYDELARGRRPAHRPARPPARRLRPAARLLRQRIRRRAGRRPAGRFGPRAHRLPRRRARPLDRLRPLCRLPEGA